MTTITPYTIPSPTSPNIPHTISSNSQDSKQPLLSASSNFTVSLHKSLFTTTNSAFFRRTCQLHRVNVPSPFFSFPYISYPKSQAFAFHPASSSSSSYQRHQIPQEASMSPLTLNEQLPAYSEIMMTGATSHQVPVSEKRTR